MPDCPDSMIPGIRPVLRGFPTIIAIILGWGVFVSSPLDAAPRADQTPLSGLSHALPAADGEAMGSSTGGETEQGDIEQGDTEYTVAGDASAGTLVGLTAPGIAHAAGFRVTGGNDDGAFVVDATTGAITVGCSELLHDDGTRQRRLEITFRTVEPEDEALRREFAEALQDTGLPSEKLDTFLQSEAHVTVRIQVRGMEHRSAADGGCAEGRTRHPEGEEHAKTQIS